MYQRGDRFAPAQATAAFRVAQPQILVENITTMYRDLRSAFPAIQYVIPAQQDGLAGYALSFTRSAARAIGIEVEKVRQLTQTFSTSREGPLRVIADPTYGRVLLAPLVPRFLDSFPDIALDVVLDAGEDAEWDVAIRAGVNEDPTLGARLLGAPPAVLCATPAYLLKHPAPDRPEGLRDHALLTPAGEGAEYCFQMTKASARAEVRVRPKLAVDDPAVLHSATVAGLGIGLLPEFLCRQGVATAKLRKVLADWHAPSAAPLYAVFPAGLENDHRVRSFVDFAAANIVPALAH